MVRVGCIEACRVRGLALVHQRGPLGFLPIHRRNISRDCYFTEEAYLIGSTPFSKAKKQWGNRSVRVQRSWPVQRPLK
jgi:hypothetical protein